LCVCANVFAASSSANIYEWQSQVSGPETVMSGTLYLSGNNNTTSSNELWIEAYKVVAYFPDTKLSSTEVSIGGSLNTSLSNQPNGMYYVNLDPDGIGSTGCNGSGTLHN
jgi:hypothetical protein